MKTFFRILSTLALLFGALQLNAQQCDCLEQLDWLVQKMTLNYPGYRDKVTSATKADFEQHTTRYGQLTGNSSSDSTCLRLLNEWAAWFKDRHIQFSYNTPVESPGQIRARFSSWESIALKEAEAKSRFDQPGCDPVEGIWTDEGGNYQVAVVKNTTARWDFAAVILKADSVWWMPGQVKFELKSSESPGTFAMHYYLRDHTERNTTARLEENRLIMEELGNWVKIYPPTGQPPAPRQPRRYYLEKLDNQTLLLGISTMNEQFRKELQQLIKDNKALLESTPNLIIDLWGNGGGSDITYKPLEKYLYTQPVVLEGMKILCTEGNIDKFRKLSKDKNFPTTSRMAFHRRANLYEKEMTTRKVYGLFSLLAIFIACLGLLALAAFTAERRTKEIGIRKVLGATTTGIIGLLTKDFLRLVVVGLFIASPIAWYAMNRWLQDFHYRINIEWWVFALAGLLAVAIAFLAVSFQSVKAALMNPVRSLRSE